jgi:hypothetical protein
MTRDVGGIVMANREQDRTEGQARRHLVVIALVLFAAALLYRRIAWGELQAWSVFFHGLPTILVIFLVYAGPRRSFEGRVFAGVTIALLLAGTIAGEGFICIVLAAPFVYLIAGLVLAAVSAARNRSVNAFVIPAALVASFAGGLSPAGMETATVTTTVSAREAASVAAMLAATPEAAPVISGLLSFGFPQPVSFEGSGLAIGDERIVSFSDGGSLALIVTERGPRRAVFRATTDTTVIGDWIEWDRAEFTWSAGDYGTEVTLTLSYRRALQPGWYFGPIVRAGVDEAGEHLLDLMFS